MYPEPSRTEATRTTYPYERQHTQPTYNSQPYSFAQRAPIELPRPLEPRPTLQTSLSEASGSHQRHQDAFRGPSFGASDYRSHGPNLPGLRDILTPNHHTPPQHTYESAQWGATNGGVSRYPPGEAHQRHNGWHPPLALHTPVEPAQTYPIGRRLDLPVLESSPVARNPPQSLPVSPFTGYPEARDYADARPERGRQPSANSYPPNGLASPYAGPSEDLQYRNGTSSGDRQQPFPIPGVGNEPQRKYLGVKEVAGEGAYHLYEGGYRIPTSVDGEQVNPAWGLTKANKPRKRLALACLDCREKKIKCEPGVSSCLQCEKAKRPCRRAPLHPTQAEGAASSPAWQNTTGSPGRKGVSDPTPAPREGESDLANKRRSREDPSPPNVPSKKHRSASPIVMAEDATVDAVVVKPAPSPVAVHPPIERCYKTLAWDEDPYAVDRDTTTYLLGLYFAHINDATYTLYPRNVFMRWVTTTPDKCQLERMVLYAMLAVGSIFADDHHSGVGKDCAQIAMDALAAKMGSFNPPVVQTRLMMAVYHSAKGHDGLAWEYAGSAIRACHSSASNMQVEHEPLEDVKKQAEEETMRREFGLTYQQWLECKRRTFWSCFLMDRYEYGRLCAISLHDIFLQLPSSESAYERGLKSEAPCFNNGIIDASKTILTPVSPICPMAWACLLAAVWGDVFTFSHRMKHRSNQTFLEAYENFYAETYNRLQGWSSRLPDYLQYNEKNIARSMREGYAAVFVSVHALYHLTLMRLNRYVWHQCLDADRIKRNIRAAHHHAFTLLNDMNAIHTTARQLSPNDEQLDLVFSTPFIGHAITAAVDIAGAGGLDTNIRSTLDTVGGGVDCLRALSRCWNSARTQFGLSQKRLYGIQNILARPFKANGGAWLGRQWGMMDPLEKEARRKYDWQYDCIFTDSEGYSRIYFDALREDESHGRPQPGSVRIA